MLNSLKKLTITASIITLTGIASAHAADTGTVAKYDADATLQVNKVEPLDLSERVGARSKGAAENLADKTAAEYTMDADVDVETGAANADATVKSTKDTIATYDADATLKVNKVEPLDLSERVGARSKGAAENLADKTAAEYTMDVDVDVDAETADADTKAKTHHNAAIVEVEAETNRISSLDVNELKKNDGELVQISGVVSAADEDEFELSDATGTVTINASENMNVAAGDDVTVIGQVDSGLFGTEVDAKQLVRTK